VVQNSANSGVGRSLIAIAKARGWRTINFIRRQEFLKELKAAGGDIVLVDEPGAFTSSFPHSCCFFDVRPELLVFS